MKPRFCEVPHNPPFSYGDCIRACIATMIDRDDVPHVFDVRPVRLSWITLRKYLKQHGKFIALFAIDHGYGEFMGAENDGVPYLLLGGTEQGDHAVVCVNGEVVHNPDANTVITKRHSQGFYVVGVIGDLIA